MSGTDEVYSVNKDIDTNEITQKISCEEITEQDPNAKENCKNSVSNINKNMVAQQESHTNSNFSRTLRRVPRPCIVLETIETLLSTLGEGRGITYVKSIVVHEIPLFSWQI